MTQRVGNRLDFSKKLLLTTAAMGAVATPLVFGLMNAQQTGMQSEPVAKPTESFEVASIKPNKSGDRGVRMGNTRGRFTATNVTPKMLIRMAYKVQDFQISGGPSWLNSEHYDIEAKLEESEDAEPWKLSEDQRKAQEERRRRMVQSLLADRFKLTLHRETKELPVYALVVAKNGPKLQESTIKPGPPEPVPTPDAKGAKLPRRGLMMRPGQLSGQSATLAFLVDALSTQLGRTVVDRTGLKGIYDFTLQWTPDQSQGNFPGGAPGPGPEGKDMPPPPDPNGPTIFTAIQEQLGLKLESQKGPVEILVIDRAEQPSEN